MSTLKKYLEEDGAGYFKNFQVPDLLPPSGNLVELLLVVESPHSGELRTGLPLAGDAGQKALAFLAPDGPPPEALGPFLATLHVKSDFRIGIMNASPVPLQRSAFKWHRSPPELLPDNWDLLRVVRRHKALRVVDLPTQEAKDANSALLPGLQSRISAVTLSSNATIFIAGNFVHRTWDSLENPPKKEVLPISHPSHDWWIKTKHQNFIDHLSRLKTLFARLTS